MKKVFMSTTYTVNGITQLNVKQTVKVEWLTPVATDLFFSHWFLFIDYRYMILSIL